MAGSRPAASSRAAPSPASYNPASRLLVAVAARPAAFGASLSPLIYRRGIDRLDAINDRRQRPATRTSRTAATGRCSRTTSSTSPTQFDVTVGLRYTNERKKFDATFGNDNTACTLNQASLLPFLANPALSAALQAASSASAARATAPRSSTAFRSTTSARRTSSPAPACCPTSRTTICCSTAAISRGYKAGGFNLDRSALQVADLSPFASRRAARRRWSAELQFDPEIVDAFELGGKYSAAA